MKTAIMKILKISGIILAVITAAVTILAGIFAVKGYMMYHSAVSGISVEEMAEKVKSGEGFVRYDEMPEFYVKAVVSVEDRRFFRHNGVDPRAICRALLYDVKTLSFEQGGSTITQQLAKNLWFTQEKSFERKFAEVFMAWDIESKLSKQEIFELYVNSIYFGDGYYGIGNAAEGYYGKPANELTDGQCAMLAGLPNAPGVYSLTENPDLAKQRLSQVLDAMERCDTLEGNNRQELLNSV